MKKILANKGETLTETLFAMMIIVAGSLILAGAITSVARINFAAKKQITEYDSQKETEIGLEIYFNGNRVEGITGHVIKSDRGSWYYYYETSMEKQTEE